MPKNSSKERIPHISILNYTPVRDKSAALSKLVFRYNWASRLNGLDDMTKRKPRKSQGNPEGAGSSTGTVGATAAGIGLPPIKWRWLGIICGVVAAVPFFLYMNTFWMGLVFNDNLTLSNAMNGESAAPIDVFVRPFTQPWVRASFLGDIAHYGSQFGWYHFVNVWLHLSTCVVLVLLLYLVARRAATSVQREPDYNYIVAGLAGLIYAVHPFAVQTATYLSARYASMGASNFLPALLFAGLITQTRGAIRIWCGIVTICFFLMCLASSEIALFLAPTMVALFFLLKPPKRTWIDWAIDHPFLVGLTTAAGLLVPFLLIYGFDPLAAPNFFGMPRLEPVAYFATQTKALLTYYTRCFLVPVGLSIDPPFSRATDFTDVLSILGVILLGGIVYALVRWRRQPILFVAIWLTLAGFLPHAMLPQQDAVSDAAIYLSIGGMSVFAAWFLLEMFRGTLRAIAPPLVLILAILGGLSVAHNLDFRTEQALLTATLNTNRNSELALAYSAMERMKQNDYAGTIKEADEALAQNPKLALALVTKGQAQMRLGHYAEAQATLENAVKTATEQKLPIRSLALFTLAEAFVHLDRFDKADANLQEALKADPQHPRSVYVLGLMALKKREYPNAMIYLQRAFQNGVPESALPLGRAMLGVKDFNEAMAVAKYLEKQQNSPEAQLLLGNAALATNDLATAEKSLKEALKARREDPEVMALLSIVYQRKGDKVLAESYHKDAVKRDPDIFSKLLLPL